MRSTWNKLLIYRNLLFKPASWIVRYIKQIVLILIVLLDPFGITSASDQASAAVANKLAALWYDTAGQQQVTVVLIDDQYLRQKGLHWPMSYNEQAKLFKSILQHKPKSLFIDLLYTHDRSTEDNSLESINKVFRRYIMSDKAAIYVAAAPSAADTKVPLKLAQPTVVSWSGFDGLYPLQVEGKDTAAWALYKEHCRSNSSCTDEQLKQNNPLSVQWGLYPDPIQSYVTYTAGCEPQKNTLLQMFNLLASEIFWRLQNRWSQPCPYSRTLPAAALSANDPAARQLQREFLTDKLVIVGAAIEGAPDLILSPVHGKIPGAYLHAMALDNLITQGADYNKAPEKLVHNLNWITLVELALLSFILYLGHSRERGHFTLVKVMSQKVGLGHVTFSPVQLFISTLLLIFCTGLTIWLWADIEMINWLGLSLLSLSILDLKHKTTES